MEDLFLHELRDLHSAEKQLLKALPKMVKAAKSEKLRRAFENHLKETETQYERLERIFELLSKASRGPVCKAMEGLIEEASDLLKEDADPALMDAALIGAAQRVEHYEIAGYGTARTYAQQLGHTEAADLLQETLAEEKAADEKLSELAYTDINATAEQASSR
jgi:ferritin-like metal-binding protein YciE